MTKPSDALPPSRREVVAGIAALGVGCGSDPEAARQADAPPLQPAPERAPEPGPWNPPGELDEVAFAQGVVVGDVTTDGALISAHTSEPACKMVLVKGIDDQWDAAGEAAPEVVGGTATWALENLDADAVYRVVCTSEDGSRRSADTRFRTGAIAPRKVVFGASSCMGHDNPDWPTLALAGARDFDFFLLLGDTIYAGGSRSFESYRSQWDQALSHPSVRALTASTGVVATWDDHEVANNWAVGDNVTAEEVATATDAFRDAIPMREGPGGTGLWRSVKWGELVEIIVMDSRGERSGDDIVSAEQLSWATETVRQSTATFKLVLCSVHLTDHELLLGVIEAQDRWQGSPVQRAELANALSEVPGVLVLTGDMHFGATQRISPPGVPGDAVWEVACGPAGSTVVPVGAIAEMMLEVPEQYDVFVDDWSYCAFEADPLTMKVSVQFIGDSGDVLAVRVLDLS